MTKKSLNEEIKAVLESNNRENTIIRINVPTFIRMLEYAKEDAKDDMALHKVTENIMALLMEVPHITMADYDKIVKIK